MISSRPRQPGCALTHGHPLELIQQHGSILEVRCRNIDWQVDSMAVVCDQLSPFCSLIERLNFTVTYSPSEAREDDIESTQFLELFRRIYRIRSLRVSECLVPLIATALQDIIGPRATEVLPNLRDLFLGGSAIPELYRKPCSNLSPHDSSPVTCSCPSLGVGGCPLLAFHPRHKGLRLSLASHLLADPVSLFSSITALVSSCRFTYTLYCLGRPSALRPSPFSQGLSPRVFPKINMCSQGGRMPNPPTKP
jgi:hypothetical protein